MQFIPRIGIIELIVVLFVIVVIGWIVVRVGSALVSLVGGLLTQERGETFVVCMHCQQQTASNQAECTHCGHELR